MVIAAIVAASVFAWMILIESLHARRVRKLGRLAFGPNERPNAWVRFVPLIRSFAFGSLAGALVLLFQLPPKVHHSAEIPDNKKKHIVLVLDVSPSMTLEDAGPERKASRRNRAKDLMESFFQRVPMERYLTSVVACYNGAKPVVVDTKDIEVVRNVLNDLPLNYAFLPGKTDLFAGLQEAFRVAAPFQPKSTIVILVTDGDTVPATGMPRRPASVSEVLLVGVGDTKTGRFIDGRASRQDSSTLRQMAVRLNGHYHDGNEKHLPSELIKSVTARADAGPFEQLGAREYALLTCAISSIILAGLPVLLHYLGTRWRPGVNVYHDARTAIPARAT
jgi:Ca-activated chloride channel family protein